MKPVDLRLRRMPTIPKVAAWGMSILVVLLMFFVLPEPPAQVSLSQGITVSHPQQVLSQIPNARHSSGIEASLHQSYGVAHHYSPPSIAEKTTSSAHGPSPVVVSLGLSMVAVLLWASRMGHIIKCRARPVIMTMAATVSKGKNDTSDWEAEVVDYLDEVDEEDKEVSTLDFTDPIVAPDNEEPKLKYPIDYLLPMLTSSDREVRADAAQTIRVIASDKLGRVRLRKGGAVPALFAAARGPVPIKAELHLAIARLAINLANHPDIAKEIHYLTTACEFKDPKVQVYSLAALGLLADNAEYKLKIATKGGVATFKKLLQSKDADVRKRAISLFGALAGGVSVNVEPVLLSLAEELRGYLLDQKEVLRESAASVIGLFCFQNSNLQYWYAKADVFQPLVNLLREGTTDDAKIAAAGALASLVTADTNGAIAAAGGNEALVNYLASASPKGQFLATRALTYLALFPANVGPIVEAGGIELLVDLIRNGPQNIKGPAVLALGQLATIEAYVPRVAATGIARELMTYTSTGDSQVNGAAMFMLKQFNP